MMIIFIMALPIMYGLLIHDAVTMPEERLREFEMSDDYRTDSAIIRGRLRVVKPDYRF